MFVFDVPIRIIDYNRFVLRRHMASLGRTCIATAMAVAALGCNQGSYPISASVCDEWCDVNYNNACPARRQNSPVDCVRDCERERKPKESECVPFFGSLVGCLASLPPDQSCQSEFAVSCSDEEQATIDCIFEKSYPNAPKSCIDWCKVSARLSSCGDFPLYMYPYDYRSEYAEGCVATCMLYDFPNEPECVPAFEGMVQCLGSLPIEHACNPDIAGIPGGLSCSEKLAKVISCEISTSYPDNPTPCDDWCNTQVACPGNMSFSLVASSDKFDRAGCVDDCKARVMPKKMECIQLFLKWTECLKNPSTACDWDAGAPCAESRTALDACEN
jgi:hypothetical protein